MFVVYCFVFGYSKKPISWLSKAEKQASVGARDEHLVVGAGDGAGLSRRAKKDAVYNGNIHVYLVFHYKNHGI
jgi:hypothetical protein